MICGPVTLLDISILSSVHGSYFWHAFKSWLWFLMFPCSSFPLFQYPLQYLTFLWSSPSKIHSIFSSILVCISQFLSSHSIPHFVHCDNFLYLFVFPCIFLDTSFCINFTRYLHPHYLFTYLPISFVTHFHHSFTHCSYRPSLVLLDL